MIPLGSTVYCYAQTCKVIGYNETDDTYELLSVVRLPPRSPQPAGFVEMPHHYPAVPVDDLLKWAPV